MKFTIGSMLVLLGVCLGEDQNANTQQEAQKEVVMEVVDQCPLGAGRCGGGAAGNQYARGQMDNGASRMGQFAGQGNFGAIDSTAFAASFPYRSGGQMRMPPNMFYGSQFINQVQQCPPGSNCAGQQPSFPTVQPSQQPPIDQGQMMPPQNQGQMPPMDQGQMMPPQDQGQMPPQDQGQMPPQDQGQDGTMPTMQDGSMPSGDASQQKQQFGQCQCQQQQQYEQTQQQQQQYGQYGQYQQQPQQPFCAGSAGGMGAGPSYGMPGGGPSYEMPGNMYMNMMQQNPMGPYGGQPSYPMGMGMPPCARAAAAAQGPWMNYGRGGCGGSANMQQIYG